MTPETAALRGVLQRQADVLAPIVSHLRAATVHPVIAPHDWNGPASDAYAALERRVRSRVAAAESEASAALHSTRVAIGQLGG